ncbi:MAG: hypothetical protein RR980_06755 [Mucinivorans sp.]
MKNISIIATIEAQKNNTIVAIKFIQQSASLSVESSETPQGIVRKYKLEFKIAGISPAGNAACSLVRAADTIIATDVDGVAISIGGAKLRHRTKSEAILGGRAGNFRGYLVTVDYAGL